MGGGLREYSHAHENEPSRKESMMEERKERVQSKSLVRAQGWVWGWPGWSGALREQEGTQSMLKGPGGDGG